jgi:hypothetical protein
VEVFYSGKSLNFFPPEKCVLEPVCKVVSALYSSYNVRIWRSKLFPLPPPPREEGTEMIKDAYL